MLAGDKLITVAIHTYEKALILKTLLEREGIETVIHNVNLIQPVISSGVRVRIHERDLPKALQVIEATPSDIAVDDAQFGTKKVLIPVDFSECSVKVCALGFDFAYRIRGEVVLLYAFLSPTHPSLLPFSNDEGNDEARAKNGTIEKLSNEKMQKFSQLINEKIGKKEFPKVAFTTVVTEGIPETAILNYSKELKPQVIVMGTCGKSKKEVMGSVAAEVLDAGKYPVLTVPENISLNAISKIRNVVFFSNINQQDMLSFDSFSRIIGELPINVTIIPIEDRKRTGNTSDEVKSLIEYSQKRYAYYKFTSKEISEKDFIDEFDKFVKEENVDLILIPNKKKNIFARLFNPSVAHRILFYSDTPMLVVPV